MNVGGIPHVRPIAPYTPPTGWRWQEELAGLGSRWCADEPQVYESAAAGQL
ncbi:hypothetical protein ACFVJ5_14330 [Nocardia sp. NPDC127606]|uniref:hypothetical protein n=1 Tax=Nocardia sp. NPDC127606 TaxID=3345406 RepID=UPI003629AA6E